MSNLEIFHWRGRDRLAPPQAPRDPRPIGKPLLMMPEHVYARIAQYAQEHGITNKAALERMLEGL